MSFWIFSVLGSSLLLIYAIYRKDPVFILGQAPNLLIYFRNIWFIKRNNH
ncbi:lipid A biosynthesis protein [Fusobacterium animalis ATCC 51191]|uniref:Lipid A biosynthesis protein n=1 Tax=Fusobacterium animalis ATCC 51191 TaxID=997347 RepID=F9ERE8_9FUSO|nr:lipid A biosynthesis protein [Fusobacterium animalis ATCC 51191]